MKVIKLPNIKSDNPESDAHGLIFTTLKFVPRGCNIDEMRRRMRILKVLDERKNPLVLEDADFNLMKATYLTFEGFALVNADAIAVADAIEAAKEYDMPVPE